jgi:succinate dehydrogenase / fumarate reductase iron-sulfur subunit
MNRVTTSQVRQSGQPSNTMPRFEILRYDAAKEAPPWFQAYDVSVPPDTSVLEALLRIQDEQDPSLAFRYSCRGAICGSCAMSVNGRLQLACRVQLKNLASDHVVLEPLPRFEVVKDLVVDMTPFWEKYERIKPWLHADTSREQVGGMSEAQRERIDQYVNCILCGLCQAACPVASSSPNFTGPAALAKLYRFLADPRERRPASSIEGENTDHGAWACHTITRCISVCPKNVRPTDGIAGVRRKLLVEKLRKLPGLSRIFRRKANEA